MKHRVRMTTGSLCVALLPRLFVSAIRFLPVALLLFAFSVPALAQRGVDFEKRRGKAILRKVCKKIEKEFYDPKLHGLNWKAVEAECSRRIDRAQRVSQVYMLIAFMVEMLNDSHTHFFPPGQITKVKFGFEAIPIGKEIYISKVKAKGAAARAGLKVGDQVLRMNGLAPSRKNLGLMMLRFRVLRPVLELDLEVRRSPQVIKRVRIVAKTRTARVVGDRDNWWETFQWQAEDPERVEYSEHNGTLHVKIPNFLLSAGKIRQIAKRIQKHSAAVIDLRGNRGGYVRSLKWMLRHFVDEETDIGISLTRKKREPLRVKPRKPHISTPIVILVDGDSASAAEVFTRYLQKKGRAQVIGDRTAGAVMISLTFPMEQGIDTVVPFAVQVTVGELRMADNESLEGVGVKPDIFLLPTQEDLQKERDPVLDRALEILQKIVDEKTGKSIPPPGTVEALQKYLELEPDGRFAAAARSRIHVATTSR